jgi:hypothetical protein
MIFVVPAEKPDEILHALHAVLVRLVLHLGKAIYEDQILTQCTYKYGTVDTPA